MFVEKHSPYTGNTYNVHLRLGILANDANHFRIYCGDQYLSEMCRVSLATVKRAKAELVRDGYLRKLYEASGRRRAEFEFIFKGQPVAGQNDPQGRMAGQSASNSGSNGNSSPITTNEYKESEMHSISDLSEYRDHHPSVPMPKNFKDVFKRLDSPVLQD